MSDVIHIMCNNDGDGFASAPVSSIPGTQFTHPDGMFAQFVSVRSMVVASLDVSSNLQVTVESKSTV